MGRAEISETKCRNKETLGPAEVGEMRRASEKGKTKGTCWPGNQGSQEAVGMTSASYQAFLETKPSRVDAGAGRLAYSA